MKLNTNAIALLVTAGVISSSASANPVQLSEQLALLDQKAAASIQVILNTQQASESEKVAQIGALMRKVDFAKEVQKMRLQQVPQAARSIGQGMTCGDYNL